MVHGDSRNKGENRLQAFRDHVRNLCHSIPPPPGLLRCLGRFPVAPFACPPLFSRFICIASERRVMYDYTGRGDGDGGPGGGESNNAGRKIDMERYLELACLPTSPDTRRRVRSSRIRVRASRGLGDFRNGSRSSAITERSPANRSSREPGQLETLIGIRGETTRSRWESAADKFRSARTAKSGSEIGDFVETYARKRSGTLGAEKFRRIRAYRSRGEHFRTVFDISTSIPFIHRARIACGPPLNESSLHSRVVHRRVQLSSAVVIQPRTRRHAVNKFNQTLHREL